MGRIYSYDLLVARESVTVATCSAILTEAGQLGFRARKAPDQPFQLLTVEGDQISILTEADLTATLATKSGTVALWNHDVRMTAPAIFNVDLLVDRTSVDDPTVMDLPGSHQAVSHYDTVSISTGDWLFFSVGNLQECVALLNALFLRLAVATSAAIGIASTNTLDDALLPTILDHRAIASGEPPNVVGWLNYLRADIAPQQTLELLRQAGATVEAVEGGYLATFGSFAFLDQEMLAFNTRWKRVREAARSVPIAINWREPSSAEKRRVTPDEGRSSQES